MMMFSRNNVLAGMTAGLLGSLIAVHVFAQEPGVGALAEVKLNVAVAPRQTDVEKCMVLGAARAGDRIVAVGEHGLIMLSDDGGKHFRQARSVPADSTLTSVVFVDQKRGWAAGHWGVILKTDDGGETWALQRSDTSVDQPLFSISFRDAEHGWAVGLWSIILKTDDGGRTWSTQKLDKSAGVAKGGLNLYSVFPGAGQDVFATGEKGTVLESADNGATWRASLTGYNGTLWTGARADDGVLYVGGLRGHIFRSADNGTTWTPVDVNATGSITALTGYKAAVVGVALDGYVLSNHAGQNGFGTRRLAERDALTAIVMNASGEPVLFSKNGLVTSRPE